MNHGFGNCFFIDPLFPNFVVYLKINYFFISNMTLFEINKLNNHTFSIPIDSLTINDLFLLFHISTKINNKTIEITAESVVSLDKFLLDFPDEKITYDYAYLFSDNLVKQLLYLEKRKQTVSAFSISDFLVIDNSFLVFINHKKILDIQDNFIEILTPYNKNSNTFFITKQMKDNEKAFDELWKVMEKKDYDKEFKNNLYNRQMGNRKYEWWKDEESYLDVDAPITQSGE